MGMFKMFSSSSLDNERSRSMFSSRSDSSFANRVDNTPEAIPANLPNPNPNNYSIVRTHTIRGYLIIEVKYHDCENYEGRKIMVYKCSLEDLKKQKLIDPHFCDNTQYHSPIARFEPTDNGWTNACRLTNIL